MNRLSLGNLTEVDPKVKQFETELNSILDELSARQIPKPNDYDDGNLWRALKQFKDELADLKEQMLKIQITYPDGKPVNYPAGGVIEEDLIKLLVDKLCPSKIALMTKSKAEEKIKAALYDFKSKVTLING